MAELGGGDGGNPPWLGQFFYGATYEEDDGGGPSEASLSEDEEYNAVQPTEEDIELYAFVESVEPVYAYRDDATLPSAATVDRQDGPIAYWIELDCIDCLFFDTVLNETENFVELDPLALDNISQASEHAIGMREALLDELVDAEESDDARATIYLYVTADHTDCTALLNAYPIGFWRKVAINALETELTSENLEGLPVSGLRLALLAQNPYIDTYQELRIFRRLVLSNAKRDQLFEVFSLNHVPDIDLPDDGDDGGGASGPLPIPSPNFPPPLTEYASREAFCTDYEFFREGTGWASGAEVFTAVANAMWVDGYATTAINIASDPARDCYVMQVGDYQFETRAETEHRVWHGPGISQWMLFLFHDCELGIMLPVNYFRQIRDPDPVPDFQAAMEWPPSPIRYALKV